MSTSRRLWYHIESVLSDIQRLCREVRAQEQAAKNKAQKKDWLAEAGGKRAKTREAAEVTPALGSSLDAGFDAEATLPGGTMVGGSLAGATLGAARAPAALDDGTGGADIVGLRAEIRKRLLLLKSKLGENLTEREVYYSLFPIVVYADELVRSAAESKAGLWLPLQHELYEIDNGGELFYQIVETLLKKDETLPLIFEIFYLCLSDGFLGMYPNDPAKIEEYKARLAFRIPTERPEKAASTEVGDQADVELVEFPKWYYVGAAAMLVMIYFGLQIFAYLEVASLP